MTTQQARREVSLDFALHPKQGLAFESPATEILYGGAAAGGKSYLMRAAACMWCAEIPKLQVFLFRRLLPDLIKNHMEGPAGFRQLLYPWVQSKLVTIVEDEIRFWNGSKIYLCHCAEESDRWKYIGAEIHVLLIDELTTFQESIYRFLRSRVRATGVDIPEKYQGRFPRILCASNPGGIGHTYVKDMFIDRLMPYEIKKMPDDEGGMSRQFIPARLEDNPSMTHEDPHYRQRLAGLGSPELVRAMADGDWNVVAGAYFSEFGDQHILPPFEIPAHWTRVRAMDHGSYHPFCVQWWAVASEDYEIDPKDVTSEIAKMAITFEGTRLIPKDSVICYREWYGASGPNKGLKMTVEEIADGILTRERGDGRIAYGVTGKDVFMHKSGPSLAERFKKCGVMFREADNNRLTGWDQFRQRLKGYDGIPMGYWFSTCKDSIRTIPSLQHDIHKPEDCGQGEDHPAEASRYFFMSRPYGRLLSKPKKVKTIHEISLNDLWDDRSASRSMKIRL